MTAIPEQVGLEPDETAVALGRGATVGVAILALLRVLEAVLLAASALGLRPMPLGIDTVMVNGYDLVPAFAWASALLSAVAGLGLLAGKRWGWVLTMLVTGLGLALTVVAVVRGRDDELRLGILVVTAFFLNQRPVRARFGIGD